ncbi:MAG: alpha/beta hydrolase [Gemmatimonadota bacterium]
MSSTVAWSDSSPHKVQFVTVAPGVSLEVLDWGGSGPPLVFLSGLQDVAHGFDDFAPRFTDHYHVLAITRRGYGASSKPAEGYDVATRVADDRAVFDSLRLDRVMLVGHSIAGDELSGFAAAYPKRVTKLVYFDAAYDHSTAGELMGVYPAPPPMTAVDSASPAGVQDYMHRVAGMRIPVAQLRAIARYDSTGHLVSDVTPPRIDSLMLALCGHPNYRAVHTPALVIYAIPDSAVQMFPQYPTMAPAQQEAARRFTTIIQAWGERGRNVVRREFKGIEVLELHGANHYVFDSNPNEVTAAMRGFLGEQKR